jgi:carbon-monoxide dehydrogenase small subunit
VTPQDAGQSAPRTLQVAMTVNGRRLTAQIEPRTLLVHVIRDSWGLTGAKIGCDTSQCGACTVLVDGRAVKSCTVLAAQADGAMLTTIESVGQAGRLSVLQRHFHDRHALQCGFCTPGMIMTAAALIADGVAINGSTVREALSGNLCRCTGYQPIVEAVLAAAADDGAPPDGTAVTGNAPVPENSGAAG